MVDPVTNAVFNVLEFISNTPRVVLQSALGLGLVAAALWLFWIIRDRRLTRAAQAREHAATHCAHGVNKFTRSCRKCAREFEQECRAGNPPAWVTDNELAQVDKALVRARKMATVAGTHLVEVTVRFRGFDGTTYARKITLGASEKVSA
jgi:hypothetical protein